MLVRPGGTGTDVAGAALASAGRPRSVRRSPSLGATGCVTAGSANATRDGTVLVGLAAACHPSSGCAPDRCVSRSLFPDLGDAVTVARLGSSGLPAVSAPGPMPAAYRPHSASFRLDTPPLRGW